MVVVVVVVLLQPSGYKFNIIYRELEFMGLWELAAGCGDCCQVGSGRIGVKYRVKLPRCL